MNSVYTKTHIGISLFSVYFHVILLKFILVFVLSGIVFMFMLLLHIRNTVEDLISYAEALAVWTRFMMILRPIWNL